MPCFISLVPLRAKGIPLPSAKFLEPLLPVLWHQTLRVGSPLLTFHNHTRRSRALSRGSLVRNHFADALELRASHPLDSGSRRPNRSLNVATTGMLIDGEDVQRGSTHRSWRHRNPSLIPLTRDVAKPGVTTLPSGVGVL
jgi:hypothetical protein